MELPVGTHQENMNTRKAGKQPPPKRRKVEVVEMENEEVTLSQVLDEPKASKGCIPKKKKPEKSWDKETPTYNPKCRNCNRRWLLETQEFGVVDESDAEDSTEEF